MNRWMKIGAGAGVILIAVAVVAYTQFFPNLDSTVEVSADAIVAKGTFDHSGLDAVQRTFVDRDGRVDYPALRKAPEGLATYVASLAVVGPTTTPKLFPTKNDQLAYYINAYNAFVLWGVVQRPDLTNVHDEKFLFFYGTSFAIDGGRTNLYHLENTTIRQGYADPRVHFALNCASLGCPKLPTSAFTGKDLDAQLERETTRFLGESRNITLADGGKAAKVSKIFDWYASDFKPSPAEWLAERVAGMQKTASLTFTPWDWSLNLQTR